MVIWAKCCKLVSDYLWAWKLFFHRAWDEERLAPPLHLSVCVKLWSVLIWKIRLDLVYPTEIHYWKDWDQSQNSWILIMYAHNTCRWVCLDKTVYISQCANPICVLTRCMWFHAFCTLVARSHAWPEEDSDAALPQLLSFNTIWFMLPSLLPSLQ